MNRLLAAGLRAIVLLVGGLPAIGAGAQPLASAVQPSRPVSDSDLDILVSAFLPGPVLMDAVRIRFEESYRTAPDRIPERAALERRYPGIHAAMGAAATEEMLRSVAASLDGIGAEIRADLLANMAAEDMDALARLFGHPGARVVTGTRLSARPGETYTQMVARSMEAMNRAIAGSGDAAALEGLLQAFAATEQGRRLLPRVEAYQTMAQQRYREAIGSAQPNAVHAGMRAANDLVRRSHPSDPLPFPSAQPR